jgi:hypothetical protein
VDSPDRKEDSSALLDRRQERRLFLGLVGHKTGKRTPPGPFGYETGKRTPPGPSWK